MDETAQQIDVERKHLEGLLKDRINFYLVFVSVFLLGLSRLDFPQLRVFLLAAVTVVSAAISLAVLRTYRLVEKALEALPTSHPYKKFRAEVRFPPNANWFLVPVPLFLTVLFFILTIICFYR